MRHTDKETCRVWPSWFSQSHPSVLKSCITKLDVDAMVNAANSSVMGGGVVDGCLHFLS